ncbi:hypothetical protein IF2G_11005 [Cordyceps javanica]|nr:hypothetical protein IF2G_11005 [Cordyceps javanica]
MRFSAASVLTRSSHYQSPSFTFSTYPMPSSGPPSTSSMISSSEPQFWGQGGPPSIAHLGRGTLSVGCRSLALSQQLTLFET